MTSQKVIDAIMSLGKDRPEHVFEVWKTKSGYDYEEHIDINSYVVSDAKVWRGSYRTLQHEAWMRDYTMRDYLEACLDGRGADNR